MFKKLKLPFIYKVDFFSHHFDSFYSFAKQHELKFGLNFSFFFFGVSRFCMKIYARIQYLCFIIHGLPLFPFVNIVPIWLPLFRNDVNSNVTKTTSRKHHTVTPPIPTHTTSLVHLQVAYLCSNKLLVSMW